MSVRHWTFMHVAGREAQRSQCTLASGEGGLPLPVGLLEVGKEEVGQQEVAEVVHGDRELVALNREGRLGVDREVDCGVAHDGVEGASEGAEVVNELVDRLQRCEVALKVGEAVAGDADLARLDLHGHAAWVGSPEEGRAGGRGVVCHRVRRHARELLRCCESNGTRCIRNCLHITPPMALKRARRRNIAACYLRAGESCW